MNYARLPEPSISVVIPTFDRPSQTERAIRSVLAQSLPPTEIIIVDDASPEAFLWTGDAEGTTAIRVIRLDANRGASGARQAGIDAARGDLVAFLDSDDVWLPNKLRSQIDVFSAERSGDRPDLLAVVCGWNAVSETGRTSRQRIPIASEGVLDFASGCWFSPGSTALVPRSAFSVVGPLDGRLRRLEDLDWYLRLALSGGRLAVAPVIGATISIGRRGRFGDINHAGRLILGKADQIGDAALAAAVRCRLSAYLDVERANSALAEGKRLATAAYLARSFVRCPRLTIPLKRWWLMPKAVEMTPDCEKGRA